MNRDDPFTGFIQRDANRMYVGLIILLVVPLTIWLPVLLWRRLGLPQWTWTPLTALPILFAILCLLTHWSSADENRLLAALRAIGYQARPAPLNQRKLPPAIFAELTPLDHLLPGAVRVEWVACNQQAQGHFDMIAGFCPKQEGLFKEFTLIVAPADSPVEILVLCALPEAAKTAAVRSRALTRIEIDARTPLTVFASDALQGQGAAISLASLIESSTTDMVLHFDGRRLVAIVEGRPRSERVDLLRPFVSRLIAAGGARETVCTGACYHAPQQTPLEGLDGLPLASRQGDLQ